MRGSEKERRCGEDGEDSPVVGESGTFGVDRDLPDHILLDFRFMVNHRLFLGFNVNGSQWSVLDCWWWQEVEEIGKAQDNNLDKHCWVGKE